MIYVYIYRNIFVSMRPSVRTLNVQLTQAGSISRRAGVSQDGDDGMLVEMGGSALLWNYQDVIQCAAVNTPMDLRGDRFPMKAIGNHYPSRMCQ